MASLVTAQTSQMCKFPDEAEMLIYMKQHPQTTTGIAAKLYLPDTFKTLAAYFSNREVPIDRLKEQVATALEEAVEQEGTDEQKELLKLNKVLKTFVKEASDQPESNLVRSIKHEVLPQTIPENLEVTIAACVSIMKDVLEKAEFSPPPEASTAWTRHVSPQNVIVFPVVT